MSEPFVHPRGIVEPGASVGEGTRVWAFAHVLPDATVGADCNICDGVFVEGGAVIGDRVTVKPGVQVYTGVTLEDDVFVGPNATFTNDLYPRSRQWLDSHPTTIVRRGASIGANATILPGVEIGTGAMVGAGAVVTRSVPPHAVVVGNPARITGYDADRARRGERAVASAQAPERADGVVELAVPGVTVHRFAVHGDMRGNLTSGLIDERDGVPFPVKRWFMVYDVPTREVRGEHAHRECHQFLIAVSGSVSVVVDDGSRRDEILLDAPNVGVHLPPMVWGTQYRYERDALLLVFASHMYDPADYIRDYDVFLAERRGGPAATRS
jgi:acetyltransferase-like isoleucine patch superfamily enzyme/dTDP-4-dehydrorhamnose 3,5-epimerase-like enzyme